MFSHSSLTCNLYCSEGIEEANVAGDTSASSYRQATIPDNSDLPISDLYSGAVDDGNRRDAIKWILKVHRFFAFQPTTAYLAVNYLDRFLSCKSLPQRNGDWPWQLLSVACLSVAAKMEETQVPPLLDLQTMCSNTNFLFEPRMVQRMELFLMASLQWKLRSTTAFDFLDHFAGGTNHHLLPHRSSDIVLGALGDREEPTRAEGEEDYNQHVKESDNLEVEVSRHAEEPRGDIKTQCSLGKKNRPVQPDLAGHNAPTNIKTMT